MVDCIPNPSQPMLKLSFDQDSVIDTAGDNVRFSIDVDGSGIPLKVTLVWTDRPGRALQNILSLMLQDSQRNQWYANANRQTTGGKVLMQYVQFDYDNNVQTVVIPNPSPGKYSINIISYSVLSTQKFAVVVTGQISKLSKLQENA